MNNPKSKDIVFLILHYISIDDTRKAIQSIKNDIDTDSYQIVVVDNGSPNATGIILKEEYECDEHVVVLLSESNLGFARGNNIGLNYIRENFDYSYIVVMNNDIILYEKNLYQKLKTEYETSNFALLGPMILTAMGKCNINPGRNSVISRRDVEHKIVRYRRQLFFDKIYLGTFFEWILSMYNKHIYSKRQEKGKAKVKEYLSRREMVQLHGCFLVFSPLFFEKLDGFDGRTFLYMEEDILYAQIVQQQLKTVYLPDIKVFHNEDSSTDMISKGSMRNKKRFMRGNYVQSARVLLDVLNEMEGRDGVQ